MKKVYSIDVAGRPLTVEIGQLAQLANGAVLVRYGETVVLSTATASKQPREGIDFFPLSVDYEEKLYSVGKIPGGFIKREGKPTEKATLVSRVIDRQIRPRFPKDLRNDVVVVNTVLSVEQDNSPEFAAIMGSVLALCISDIPFNGPIAGIILGLVDEQVVINPNSEQRSTSDMYVTLSGDKDKIIMIEAGANEVPDEVMLDALQIGHEEIKKLIAFIDSIVQEIGKPKFEYESTEVPEDIWNAVWDMAKDSMKAAITNADKATRDNQVDAVCSDVQEKLAEVFPEQSAKIGEALYKLQKKIVRDMILNDHQRVDGRDLMEIRALSAEVSLLPRTHGSALFQRGQTQVLTNVTLGPLGEGQKLDGLDELEEGKRYMHHYNFPPYSVGRQGPQGSWSSRNWTWRSGRKGSRTGYTK